jgi:hypothetical protein
VIGRRRDIGLIERPECKRRWSSEPWEKKEQAALRTWLLDRCEERELWYVPGPGGEQPRPMTVNRLADRLLDNPDVVAVARLYAGPDAELAGVLRSMIADEHVPYLAQLRYTATGLDKRGQWERTWDLQRQEDAEGSRLDIPVPPKYRKEDFSRTSFWSQRGKLDVPKERFISYPQASPGSDDSLLLGWAGWDHRQQALALVTLIEERSATDGWDASKLTPLLAGLLELMPWIRQWHNDVDPTFGASPAEEYDTYLAAQLRTHGLTEEALSSWTAPPVRRGRPPKSRPGVRTSGRLEVGGDLNPIIEIAVSATGSSAAWAFCWMIVSRRSFKSQDHAVDVVREAPANERADVAKAVAEIARAYGRERPSTPVIARSGPVRRGQQQRAPSRRSGLPASQTQDAEAARRRT